MNIVGNRDNYLNSNKDLRQECHSPDLLTKTVFSQKLRVALEKSMKLYALLSLALCYFHSGYVEGEFGIGKSKAANLVGCFFFFFLAFIFYLVHTLT